MSHNLCSLKSSTKAVVGINANTQNWWSYEREIFCSPGAPLGVGGRPPNDSIVVKDEVLVTTVTPSTNSNAIVLADVDTSCPYCYSEAVYVCGASGKDYLNPCYAICHGELTFDLGQCQTTTTPIPTTIEPCPYCMREYVPVCTKDGAGFFNPCYAYCHGYQFFDYGVCPPQATECPYCVGEYVPVCGGGREFYNPCYAHCAGQHNYADGTCTANNAATVAPATTVKPQTIPSTTVPTSTTTTVEQKYDLPEGEPCWWQGSNLAMRDAACAGSMVCAKNGNNQRDFGCTSFACCTYPPTTSTVPTTTEMEGCNCIALMSPVCANGISYINPCFALCEGISSWVSGNCTVEPKEAVECPSDDSEQFDGGRPFRMQNTRRNTLGTRFFGSSVTACASHCVDWGQCSSFFPSFLSCCRISDNETLIQANRPFLMGFLS